MVVDTKELKALPPVISKEQFYKACHISKRMAEYVLKSGLVKCERSRKKTHTYKIRRADVIAFVKDRAANPAKYYPPLGKGDARRKSEAAYLPLDPLIREAARAYYEKLLKNDPEILDTAYVAALTGYGHDTVLRWAGAGKLATFCKLGPRYLYSKENLLDFFTSDSYNRIPVKSHLHIRHIKNIK